MTQQVLKNRYKIIQPLASGGFGETFLAQDQDLPSHPYCIAKRLKIQCLDEDIFNTSHRLFQQEAEILHKLGNHPQIPTLLAHFTENNNFYLIQEYIKGHELKQELSQGNSYPIEQVLCLTQEILEILQFVHDNNVIHRDIKPANLIRREADQKLFLIDFGAVKQIQTQLLGQTENTIRIGTPGYMSPEQATGKPRFCSDIYGVGMIALQALTGVTPINFEEDNTGELNWKKFVDLPLEISQFFDKMVAYDYRQRFQTVNEVLRELTPLLPEIFVPFVSIYQQATEMNTSSVTLPDITPLPLTENELPVGYPITKEEQRLRQILINKVRNFWIKGVLETSLHGRALIELGLENRQDLVEHPWGMVLCYEQNSEKSLPPNTKIISEFQALGVGRSMLILGDPGAGKTTTLLELCRDLLLQSEKMIIPSIPVVCNLSSWCHKKMAIDQWLIQELQTKYQVNKQISQDWLKEGKFLLLLDGLDEVKATLQNDCILAINHFMETHGTTELVICSRIQDYQTLSHKLKVQSAIYLKPLTHQQISEYLSQMGQELTVIQNALQEDTHLQDLAKCPLMLSIMTLAYWGISQPDLPQFNSLEDRRKHLFNCYLQRMFNRKKNKLLYSENKVKFWLSHLAIMLIKDSQTVFLIEGLQPSYLASDKQRKLYALGVSLLGGLAVGIVGGLNVEMIFHNGIGLIAGLLMGLGGGIASGVIFGLILNNIEPMATFKWSTVKAKKNIRLGIKISVSVGIIFCFIASLIFTIMIHHWAGIAYGLVYGLSGAGTGIIFVLQQGLTGGDIEQTTTPNQGIIRSTQNAILFSAIGILSMISIAKLVGLPLTFGVRIGLLFGLFSPAGIACLQHFTLRLILYFTQKIPWNYRHFLDYAVQLVFLQKVGGGYIFIHRLLLEHFANLEIREPNQ